MSVMDKAIRMREKMPLMLKPKKSKYRNVETEVHGIKFDSKAEAHRYCKLRNLEIAGEISSLTRQVKYLLIPSKRRADGTLERAVYYVADFVYFDHAGASVVEDVKGMRTKDYILKRKLMLAVHDISIREV